jgi:diketogulonate reductase-like aldo/keto reductase
VPIPKSVSKARVESNIDLYDFELSDAEMKELHSLDERTYSSSYSRLVLSAFKILPNLAIANPNGPIFRTGY